MTAAEIVGLAVTAVGATWALRSKLSDIEKAIAGHVERDGELHANHSERIVRLEAWKGRSRR